MIIVRNIEDRTNNPVIHRMTTVVQSRIKCELLSRKQYGIYVWHEENTDPTEFYKNGRKFRSHASACKAHI